MIAGTSRCVLKPLGAQAIAPSPVQRPVARLDTGLARQRAPTAVACDTRQRGMRGPRLAKAARRAARCVRGRVAGSPPTTTASSAQERCPRTTVLHTVLVLHSPADRPRTLEQGVRILLRTHWNAGAPSCRLGARWPGPRGRVPGRSLRPCTSRGACLPARRRVPGPSSPLPPVPPPLVGRSSTVWCVPDEAARDPRGQGAASAGLQRRSMSDDKSVKSQVVFSRKTERVSIVSESVCADHPSAREHTLPKTRAHGCVLTPDTLGAPRDDETYRPRARPRARDSFWRRASRRTTLCLGLNKPACCWRGRISSGRRATKHSAHTQHLRVRRSAHSEFEEGGRVAPRRNREARPMPLCIRVAHRADDAADSDAPHAARR